MGPDNYPEIDEAEAWCPKCGETVRHFIEDGRAACSKCGRLRNSEGVITEAEETGRLNLQEFYERPCNQ